LTDFCDQNSLQHFDLARFPIARTIPFERKTPKKRSRPPFVPLFGSSGRISNEKAAGFGARPSRAASFRELAHAPDIALTLRHRDNAAGVEKIEGVRRLDALIIGGQGQRMPVLGRVAAER